MTNKMGFSSAEDFLKCSKKFRLGFLPTEQSHPETWELSEWANQDLQQAIKALKKLDQNVLNVLQTQLESCHRLSQEIQKVLSQGGRIFLCGCGATGRLSLLIESLWNRAFPDQAGKVMSFMAGGDVALVQSVEGFEDHSDYGERQLKDLGFSSKDLLISSSEGGETPFVLGATQSASKISSYKSYFLYCNPTDLLVKNIQRSREVIKNKNVVPIELFTGPMAIAGSTRMQASTILQVFICMALFLKTQSQMKVELENFDQFFKNFDFNFLSEFVKKESDIYKVGQRITYSVHEQVALNVFTDTTERAPTFNMKAFDHPDRLEPPLSLCYIRMEGSSNSMEAWEMLLARPPRSLNWSLAGERVSDQYLKSFNFSPQATSARHEINPSNKFFEIRWQNKNVLWKIDNLQKSISVPEGMHLFWSQALLKILLNIHSTLVMGRLGRYQNNLMTWVVPSNGKLIDRTARYVLYLLEKDEIKVTYDRVVNNIFSTAINPKRSMVEQVFNQLKTRPL